MKKLWNKIIGWLKKTFKVFVLDSGLLEIGIDRIIKIILESKITSKVQFNHYSEKLGKILKEEFGNIKPINNIIDSVVKIIDSRYGMMIDKTKGGIKVKLKLLKKLLIREITDFVG